jgi:surface protein
MFNGCTSLASLTLGDKFDTSKVTSMNGMFNGCTSLASLTLYQASSPIVKQLSSNTWTVINNESATVGTVTVSQGTSATWNTSEPDPWTYTPWKLSLAV